jgi:uncharacterized protein (DUF1015 family)
VAHIIPIRGLRYHTGPDLALLITPPYDVIDRSAQEELYARHPCNMIRLEYGASLPGDGRADNRYTRAAAFFKRWREQGVLAGESSPALYFYEQTFSLAGQRVTRRGFLCGLGLEPYGKNILPHEDTISSAREDRMRLITACRANFSPIFGLYIDPERTLEEPFRVVSGTEPVYAFADAEGQFHRLWVVTDQTLITAVTSFMSNLRVYIADGHHRFETALHYCLNRQAGERTPVPAPYHFVLTLLVNVYDPGLVILPTHRLVKAPPGLDIEALTGAAKDLFRVTTFSQRPPLPDNRYIFGLYAGNNRSFHLALKEEYDPVSLSAYPKPPAWKRSEVAVLHALLLDRYLQIGPGECKAGERIAYTHDPVEACLLVDRGEWDFAFFLNPPRIDELVAVAEAGDRMPQKSTYFYPKVSSGFVIYAFDQ